MGLFGRKQHGATTTTTHSSGGGAGSKLAKLLAPILILGFLAQLGMCAAAIDQLFDGSDSSSNGLLSGVRRSQVAAILAQPLFLSMLLLTLIASSVGAANMLMAFLGGRKHHDVGTTTTGTPNVQSTGGFDKHAALSSALTTFGLLALAFGFSCKAINAGVPGGETTGYGRLYSAINAFNVINLFFLILYLAALMMARSNHAAATTHTRGAVATHKHVDTPPTTHGAHTGGTTGYANEGFPAGTAAAPATTVPGTTNTRGIHAA